MDIKCNNIYHIYNRGNNRETIFYQRRNYYFFLNKMRRNLLPNCQVLAYCLMPNHFHFLIYATEVSIQEKRTGPIVMNKFSDGIKNLLAGYAKAINKQQGRTGSLFTKNTRANLVRDVDREIDYATTCFHYIHQNPLKTMNPLASKLDDWPFSSFHEYTGEYKKGLCDIPLAKKLISVSWDKFYEISHQNLSQEAIQKINSDREILDSD
ncbi:MAG: transposase [Saprospiraceae bacterium]|nr:transposase [Saprospiraceae bacterium]